jgi:hypothetical protein
MDLSPGDAVRIEMTKWWDHPHWENDATYLGSDEHGDWLVAPAGTPMARPGLSIVAENDMLMLVPAPGPDLDRGWMATFHRVTDQTGRRQHTYVDMTTAPRWDGRVVRAVDLDLDVIRFVSGEVVVDDEDEFAEHQERYAYPAEIIALARHSCTTIHDAVLTERVPFDDATPQGWWRVFDDRA